MLVDRTAGRIRVDAEYIGRRSRDIARELTWLGRYFDLHTVFMHVGAGDCTLARKSAGDVERVYAIDVSEDVMGRLGGPPNMVRVVHDGVRIPVPEASVDLAYNRQLVLSQLPGICRALRDGGVYWTYANAPARELRRLFLEAGFSKLRFYVGPLRVPYLLALIIDDPFRIAAVK